MVAQDRLITIRETCERLACSRSTTYTLEKRDPTFPRRIRLSSGAVRFSLRELEEWVAKQPRGVGPERGRSSPGRNGARASASENGNSRGRAAEMSASSGFSRRESGRGRDANTPKKAGYCESHCTTKRRRHLRRHPRQPGRRPDAGFLRAGSACRTESSADACSSCVASLMSSSSVCPDAASARRGGNRAA